MVAEEVRDITPIQCAARKLGWAGLLAIVADVYGVSPAAIVGRDRARVVGEARQMYYFVLYEFLYWSNAAIARTTERDSSSVSHGLTCMRRRLVHSEVQYALQAIESDIVRRGRFARSSLYPVSGGRS